MYSARSAAHASAVHDRQEDAQVAKRHVEFPAFMGAFIGVSLFILLHFIILQPHRQAV